jgi:hypothetical protein
MTDAFAWDAEKNAKLQSEREFGFEDIVAAVEVGGLLDDVSNPNSNFPHQRMLIVALSHYAVAVPCVADGGTKFLKTAFYSRRATKIYLNR